MTDSIENWTPIAEKYHPLTCGSIDGTDDYPHDKAVLRALNSSYKPNKFVNVVIGYVNIICVSFYLNTKDNL